jgi:outer membrane receptor protein involved in Fe transport
MHHHILRMSASAFVLALAMGAQAQTAGAPPESELDELVVTGSRVVRDGFQAPTPVTVVGEEQLKEQAVTRLVDVSRNLPVFRNQGGARSGSNGSANGGQGSLNMRGLGANRNLIMLDRRRVVPSTGNGIVDVNILPSALVQRIDVVTGGASAAWGSDAVSGVVNFVLDTDFSGFKGELSAGVSSHGDNGEGTISAAVGRPFNAGRGHIIASAEYFVGGPQDLMDRDWLARRPGIINNPAYTATNGQPRRVVTSAGIVAAYMSTGGLINGCRTATGGNIPNCSLRGIAFGPGGSTHNFVYGTYVNPTGNMIAPAGPDVYGDYTQIYDNIKMVNPSERTSLFAHAKHDLTENVRGFVEGLYTKSLIGPSYSVPPYRFGTSATTWLSVSADNAYLPANIRAQMSGPGGGNPAGPAFLNIGRINEDWTGNSRIENTNTTKRFVTGLEGDLNDNWSWDAYYQYGQNTYYGTVQDNLITSRGGVTARGNVNLAVDAVVAPAGNAAGITPGTIVCRSTLTDPNNGCQPLNIFGQGVASQAAIDYILGDQWTRQTYRQHVVEASIHGDLFSTWAGPISFAGGASYRQEEIDAKSDPLSIESAFGIGNPKPYAGKYDVKEAFSELVIPLLKDEGFGVADLNLAGRVTDYSTSGRVETWKAGLTWTPIEDLRLRLTRSRDIRAPSLQELYTGATQARGSVIDRFKPGSVTFNIQTIGGGNASLKPEIADTLSFGAVLQPRAISGFSASVDYYRIKIRDTISTLPVQQIVDRCFAGTTALCNQISRVNGDIIEIRSTNLNLAGFETNGLDIEVAYRTPLSRFGESLPGEVGLRVLANYVGKFETSDGLVSIDVAGALGEQQPDWIVQSSAFYENGPVRVTVTNRYIASGVISNEYKAPNEIDDNSVAARLYTNLNVNYRFERWGGEKELYLNVDNVFGVEPPRGFGWGYGLNASPQYDVIGRMYKVGLRVRY